MLKLKQRPIFFYRIESGKIPYKDWLSTIKDKKAKAIIANRLDRIQEGNLGDFKIISENLYEIRLSISPGYRIYFTMIENKENTEIIILLLAGDKSTQIEDIKKAKKFLNDLFIRLSKVEKPEDAPFTKI